MTRTATMGVGLALGLAIGCAAAPFVVPPVRAGTNPQKWEYNCFDEERIDELMPKANKMGAEGWELASGAGASLGQTNARMFWCFKRALP